MARCLQLTLLAGALLAPAGAWADDRDNDRHRRGNWSRYRVWDDDDRGRFRRVYPYDFRGDKAWRKAYKERAKYQRKAWKEWEKDRREAWREWAKDRARAARDLRRHRYYR